MEMVKRNYFISQKYVSTSYLRIWQSFLTSINMNFENDFPYDLFFKGGVKKKSRTRDAYQRVRCTVRNLPIAKMSFPFTER